MPLSEPDLYSEAPIECASTDDRVPDRLESLMILLCDALIADNVSRAVGALAVCECCILGGGGGDVRVRLGGFGGAMECETRREVRWGDDVFEETGAPVHCASC